ncbi:hypothetical protein F0562_007023 [Nyssa sinensis]|uniref:Rx N-terminal domain-containing protein n=1 Tax=Nyssa sinensis TaxID=561372 RepID=A0A5J5A2L1_9ASTE|nr:hypothetical protein F0562_007023 [Nyssa sinensis]
MANALLNVVLKNLNSLIEEEIGLLWGVDKEMEKLSSTLSTIQAVLEDAEIKQLQDKALQDWLRKLKHAAYAVDDILDECATEAIPLESKGKKSGLLGKVHSSFSPYTPDNIIFRHKIGNKMKEITEKLDAIANEREKFHLRELVAPQQVQAVERRQTGSLLSQLPVYGREEDKEKIVEKLVEGLSVENLERVGNLMDAQRVNFIGKPKLRHLDLSWESGCKLRENVEQVLEGLQPHPNLERLGIHNYNGTHFPLWMGDSVLRNLSDINLSNCPNCLQLPPFGRLPSLRCLSMSTMNSLEYIDNEFHGRAAATRRFPSLEVLEIGGLLNLTGLFKDERTELFPRLHKMHITNCPKLKLPCLPSLEELRIGNCSEVLLSSISNLNTLISLDVFENVEVVSFPVKMLQNLTVLETLKIGRYTKLKVLPTTLANLISLKSIDIYQCPKLESLSEQSLPQSLQRLNIQLCSELKSVSLQHLNGLETLDSFCGPELRSLPASLISLDVTGFVYFPEEMLQNLTALESLKIQPFNKLQVFPTALANLTSLKSLRISSWSELESLSEQGLRGLQSLRQLEISNCDKLKSLSEGLQHLTALEKLNHTYRKSTLIRISNSRQEDRISTAKLRDLPVPYTFVMTGYQCQSCEIPPVPCNFMSLNSLIEEEIGLLWGVDKEMEKLSSTLSTIQAVLEDAELKQLQDKALQDWLRKLKHAAYAVDDILDECATEAIPLKSKGKKSGLLGKVRSTFLPFTPDNIIFHHKIGNKMKEITKKLDAIANERMKFHLRELVAPQQVQAFERRQTGSLLSQLPVYGREEDKEKIVEKLVEGVSDCECVSVYPIIGMGGLGKTTLAQLVFNDEKVIGHFDPRIWVCVSENFNVKRVIKAILESASGNGWEDLDLDPLQRRLQDRFTTLQKRCLSMITMNSLEYIDDNEFHGRAAATRRFPSLEVLYIRGLLNLTGLFKDERTELFPRLHRMHISNCPKLMLPCLPSLEELRIDNGSEVLLSSISNLSILISLEVSEALGVDENDEAVSFPERMLQNLTSLESLRISYCSELESLPEQGLRGLRSLRRLEINCCNKLKSLSEGLQHLTALEKLEVTGCPELQSLPAGIQSLTKLHLYIRECPEIERRCEKGKGEDWYKIAHLPEVDIY